MKYDLVLLDASAIIYRAFYGVPAHFTTSKGEVTNAVYGFTNSVIRILDQFCTDTIVVAYDAKGKTFRHEAYDEYKATRTKQPDELYVQIPRTKDVLNAFNIPFFEKGGYEADDILGTLARAYEQHSDSKHILIVSGDHDLLQLVDGQISVAVFKNGFKEFTVYNRDGVFDKIHVYPEQVTDLKSLQGDSSDNIPGVPTIGPKTASKWLQTYDNLENLYRHLDELPLKMNQKLTTYRDQAFLSKDLATIDCAVPISFDWHSLHWGGVDMDGVRDLFTQLEFKTLLSKLQARPYPLGHCKEHTSDQKATSNPHPEKENDTPVISSRSSVQTKVSAHRDSPGGSQQSLF